MENIKTMAQNPFWASLESVQFPEVLERVAAWAETPMGRKRIKSAQYMVSQELLTERHQFLRDTIRLLEASASRQISLQGATEIAESVQRASKGSILAANHLLSIRLTITAAQKAKTWVSQEDYPMVFPLLDTMPSLESLSQTISRIIDDDGNVRDSASPQLKQIRRNIQQTEGDIDRILESILHSRQWSEFIQDALVTIRAGRRVIPVKAMFRHQVPGIVHDRSASGQTVFVEPTLVVEKQNHITELHRQEEDEIRRLLTDLSRIVGTYYQECVSIETTLGMFDELLGIARYGIKTRAVLPLVGTHELRLIEARHPLIENPVPLNLSLDQTRRILIVTGPNTGGKTVTLKTTGLVVSLALSGLMVPCDGGTSVPFVDRIWVDIGDEQSIEQNLSTFSSHMARIIPMVELADDRTLCLIDEIGAGTDPDEGSALAEAVIHHFRQRRVYAVITTHYSRLKLLGFRLPDVENAQVTFDRETLTPTYHLIMGQPGSSQALYIARRLGMSEAIIQQARGYMDHDGATLSDVIDQANHLQMELRQAKQEVHDEHEALRHKMSEIEHEHRMWLERSEREKLRMRGHWETELQRLQNEMTAAIDAVRQSQGPEQARAVETLRTIWRKRGILPPSLGRERLTKPKIIAAGDYVHAQDFEGTARVIEVNGKMALVELGSLRVKLPTEDLEPAPQPKTSHVGRTRTAMALKAQSLRIECDVRGMTVDEMLEVVDKYLDDAVLAGAFQVRIIHGKGTGTLRKAVLHMLKEDPRVGQYRLGERGEGGDGVTVVTLGSVE